MLSSILVFQYGPSARLVRYVARRPAAPARSRKCIPKFRTPHVSTWVACFAVGIPAGIWDIGTFADLSNIGTLFAFHRGFVGVLVLRRTQPRAPARLPRARRLDLPILSIGCCLVLMTACRCKPGCAFLSGC